MTTNAGKDVGKGDIYSLCKGMQTSAAITSGVVPQKAKNRTTFWSSLTFPQHAPGTYTSLSACQRKSG